MKYIFRRIFFYLLALYMALTINFFLPRLMPGDPATIMFGRYRGRISPAALEALKKTFGFVDAPLWNQYLSYLSHAIRGDFGISIQFFPQPVNQVIAGGLMWTLLLSGISLVIAFTIGSLLGIFSAWNRGSRIDSIMVPILMFLNSFPYFWVAMVGLLIFGSIINVLPITYAYDQNVQVGFTLTFIGSVLKHLILPASTIVLVSVGGWMLGMRNTMISTLSEDFIVMAEAKGLPQKRIMLNYAARNAMLPNVTSFGIALGFVISGALLTEMVFTYPGLGYLLYTGVSNLDYPLIQGLFMIITVAVLLANLIVDLLYTRLDPRVRLD